MFMNGKIIFDPFISPGYCVDLTKHVADYVNIDYKIHLVKDNNYGKKFRNGTWNGMIGELVRGVGMHTYIMGISRDKSNSPRVYNYCKLCSLCSHYLLVNPKGTKYTRTSEHKCLSLRQCVEKVCLFVLRFNVRVNNF